MGADPKRLDKEIESVHPGGIGEEMGLEKGDRLVRINGEPVEDILDYIYLINDESLLVEVEKTSGEIWEIEVEKPADEDLGIVFASPTLTGIKRCRNKCVFCFVDQMPKGMRSSLYVKDDDYRLSALHGNFVTLTNLEDRDRDRIRSYHISPVNISVHATDPEVRRRMMSNPGAGEILNQLAWMADNHLSINAQIVLCPGLNDGVILERTLDDLAGFHPSLKSVAVVPVGLTRFREGLYPLVRVDREKAREVVALVSQKQAAYKERLGTRLVHLSDEFYLTAGLPFPAYEAYEGFPQIENGIGLMRRFERQVEEALQEADREASGRACIGLVTGTLAFPFMADLAKRIEKRLEGVKLHVKAVENRYFGKTITVSGLISGRDLSERLDDMEARVVLVPSVMLKEGTDETLDGLALSEIGDEKGKELMPVAVEGRSFIEAILKIRKRSV